MGKLSAADPHQQRPHCVDSSAPICSNDCCVVSSTTSIGTSSKSATSALTPIATSASNNNSNDDVKELLVIGAGPHALSLLLRLLEPDADFLSDKDRHIQAEYRSRMRPVQDVYAHLEKLQRGPAATLKQRRKKSNKKKKMTVKSSCSDGDSPSEASPPPPPLSLEQVHKSVLVVDKNGGDDKGWLAAWKHNFEALGLKSLRSLMNAHADPYDHRSLEFYADFTGREDELITLPMLCQRDKEFRGPYQVPSTAIFHDFHDLLARAYGIHDVVRKGEVLSIEPVKDENTDEPVFHVRINFDDGDVKYHKVVKTRRIVCALGPMFHAADAFWEASLRKQLALEGKAYPSHRILHPPEILPYLKSLTSEQCHRSDSSEPASRRILIVGGGITSAQLAILVAKSPWCREVKLIQRSLALLRHFDVHNAWMGPQRGRLLDNFWDLAMSDRAKMLQDSRRGGSMPPETWNELLHCQEQSHINLNVKEEVQISNVEWKGGQFHVALDDGSGMELYDMIWLSTGSENHIDSYSALSSLRDVLPVDVVNGLPVLSKDLSWQRPSVFFSPEADNDDEPEWKKIARRRLWCMGALAGLELGPDALNLIGARHGAVRVAKQGPPV